MTLTTDPAIITRVWFTFTLNDVFPEVDPDSDNEPTIEADRIDWAREFIATQIADHFPNATDITIHETGWDGDWAQISPRADANDGNTVYEPFFEWMDSVIQSFQENAHP